LADVNRFAIGNTSRVLSPGQGANATVTGIISAIIVGLIIGALGRLVLPGRQAIPIWLTILIGIVAALIGTFIANALGVGSTRGGSTGSSSSSRSLWPPPV
jgi:uncharacterized membrane protein YeaQ/YmgE (transglycosylase-associated protein family)